MSDDRPITRADQEIAAALGRATAVIADQLDGVAHVNIVVIYGDADGPTGSVLGGGCCPVVQSSDGRVGRVDDLDALKMVHEYLGTSIEAAERGLPYEMLDPRNTIEG